MHYLMEDDFTKGVNWCNDWPLITAGVGAGKTTFAIKELSKLIEKETGRKIEKILYLVPTNALKKDILDKFPRETEEIYSDGAFFCGAGFESKIGVACFAQIGNWLLDGNSIDAVPDLVFVDEADQLIKWSLCHEGNILVWDWLKQIRGNSAVVCATGTPEVLLEYVAIYTQYRFVDITPNFPVNLKSKSIQVVKNSSASTVLKTIKPNPNNKYLVYVQSAKRCEELSKKYQAWGTGFVISKYQEKLNKDGIPLGEVMTSQKVRDKEDPNKEIELREYLTLYKELPPGMNALFINDAAVAGINIDDPNIRSVIAESLDVSTAIQARGRVRHDIDSFTVVYGAWRGENLEGNQIEGCLLGDSFHRNFFLGPIQKYRDELFRREKSAAEIEAYFEKHLGKQTDNPISFISGEEFRVESSNSRKVESFDIPAIFNFEKGQTEKVVSAQELIEAAKKFPLDRKGKESEGSGKETWIREINRSQQARISQLLSKSGKPRRSYKGQTGTFYKVEILQK